MISSVVAQRYAQALFDEARQTIPIVDDVDLLHQTLQDAPDLVRCLKSPVITRQKKTAVLQTLFAERVQSATLRFLEVLVQRGRESLLDIILERFKVLTDEANGIIPVHARIQSELSAKEKTRLENALSTSLERTVRLEVTTDPDLIGGIMLKIGDTVYDGSVRHQLWRLRTRLHTQT